MQTKIHAYRFDVNTKDGAASYEALCARMAAQGTKCFETWGNGSHYNVRYDGLVVTLETKHLFDNQWNTAPIVGVSDKGLRVFDWAQDYRDTGRHIKQGHYLDITPEMIEARANRVKCGYCGKQYDKRENPPTFCTQCDGSEYLKPSDLKLLRVQSLGARTFPELSADESAYLLPIYQAEQAGKGSERAIKARAEYVKRFESDYQASLVKLQTKHDGLKWLIERGCSLRILKNVIYYDHKNVFTFGWNGKIEPGADLDWLLENLSEFPHQYNIETTHRGCIGGVE